MQILILLLVATLALIVGLLVGRGSRAGLVTQIKMLTDQLSAQRAEADRRLQEQKADDEKRLQEQLCQSDRAHQQAIEAQKALYHEATQRLMADLHNATQDLLRRRGDELSEQNKTQIDAILTPLRQNMESMRQAMNNATEQQSRIGGQMEQSVKHMMEQSQAAQRSADELARALRHQSKVQGDWGETVLSELLTANGLTEGRHFETQTSIRTDTGALLRPDVILHLDQTHDAVIDSKVSLTDFIDYVNATSDIEREVSLMAHLRSLQRHVDELSAKDYSHYIQPPRQSVGFVFMFVPHHSALIAALNRDPDLSRRAMDKHVFIADELTLFAALHVVRLNWRQIERTENRTRVYELANEMIDRVGQFCEHYARIGRALKDAQEAYDKGSRKLDDRGQSIITTGRKLISLGAQQSNRHPLPPAADE